MADDDHELGHEDDNLPAPLAREFLALQSKELEIRSQEIRVQLAELDHNRALSDKSIDVQKELFLKAPEERRKNRTQLFVFAIILVLVILALLIYLLETDQDELAKYIITIIGTAAVSGGGGYSLGLNKRKNSSKTETAGE